MYVRNQLRRYSVESVVSLALELLQHGEPQSHEHLQTWPWITCLVVKLACENDSIPLHGHGVRACPQHVFDPRRPPKLPHLWPPKLLHLAGVS